MLATSSSLNLTPSTYLAGRLWQFLLCLALFSDLSSAIIVYSVSSRVHHPQYFAALIHDLLYLLSLSVEFSVSFSSSWAIRWCRLPIFFLVSHLLRESCIFNWVQGSVQQLSLSICHLVEMRFSAPVSISIFYESWSNIESSHSPYSQWLPLCFFFAFNPFLFFNRCCVNFIIGIVLEKRDVVVLIVVCLSFVRPHFDLQCCPNLQASSSSLVSSFRSPDLSVSPFRLYDESKHFALRRLNHSFMLFCEWLSSRDVIHRRRYHCVEQPKSMSEHVSSRCNLLSILVERCPTSPGTISDFGRLLLLEKLSSGPNMLYSSLVNISTMMSSIPISCLMFKLWFCEFSSFLDGFWITLFLYHSLEFA